MVSDINFVDTFFLHLNRNEMVVDVENDKEISVVVIDSQILIECHFRFRVDSTMATLIDPINRSTLWARRFSSNKPPPAHHDDTPRACS